MAEPFEIIATPFDIYLAPVGTAFPSVEAAVSSVPAWTLLGTNGARNYAEDGITVTHEQTIEQFRGLRGTGPVKAFRTAEQLMIGFTLHDLAPEEYAKVLNDVSVEASGVAGQRITLHQGPDVAVFALLCRGTNSPLGDGLNCQFELPKVYQSANPAPVLRKGQPAGLALVFTALEDLDAATEEERFGHFVADVAGS